MDRHRVTNSGNGLFGLRGTPVRGRRERTDRYYAARERLEASRRRFESGQGQLQLDDVDELGAGLAGLLNSLIEAQETDERPREAIIGEMAEAAGRTPEEVEAIVAGEEQCPPLGDLEAFAFVLDADLDELVAAWDADGCRDPAEGGDGGQPVEQQRRRPGPMLRGYASVFNVVYPLHADDCYFELVRPGAFDSILSAIGSGLLHVSLVLNHDAGLAVASTRDDTMQLGADDYGLRVEARLGGPHAARAVTELRRRGQAPMSFGARQDWEWRITEMVHEGQHVLSRELLDAGTVHEITIALSRPGANPAAMCILAGQRGPQSDANGVYRVRSHQAETWLRLRA